MTITEQMQSRGFSSQIIMASKVAGAIMVLGGFALGGLSIFSVTVAVPARLAAVEAQQQVEIADRASIRGEIDGVTWYIKFLASAECARLTPQIKAAMRISGGVDCDTPDLMISNTKAGRGR